MTNEEIKRAMRKQLPVIHAGIVYTISAIVLRCVRDIHPSRRRESLRQLRDSDELAISCELLPVNGSNSVYIVSADEVMLASAQEIIGERSETGTGTGSGTR